MAISWVNDNETMAAGATTHCAIATPADLAMNDIVVALFGYLSTTAVVTDPAGMIPLAEAADGNNLTARLLTKLATGESASYQWSVSSAVKNGGWVGAYRGVDPVAPVHDVDTVASAAGSIHVTPAVNVPAGGWLIYGAVTRHQPGAAGVTTWSTASAGEATRWDSATNAGSADITACVFDSHGGLAAASGVTRTITASVAEDQVVVFALSLCPADPPDLGSGGPGSPMEPVPGTPVY